MYTNEHVYKYMNVCINMYFNFLNPNRLKVNDGITMKFKKSNWDTKYKYSNEG